MADGTSIAVSVVESCKAVQSGGLRPDGVVSADKGEYNDMRLSQESDTTLAGTSFDRTLGSDGIGRIDCDMLRPMVVGFAGKNFVLGTVEHLRKSLSVEPLATYASARVTWIEPSRTRIRD